MPFLKTPKQLAHLSRKPDPKIQRNGMRKTNFLLNDCTYLGEWKCDLKHGKGVLKCCIKQYEGDWENDKRHGFGVLSTLDIDGNYDMAYYGFWHEGKKQGYGVSFTKGNYYEGDWHQSKRSGFGKIWFADGSHYEGEWAEDKFEGFGKMIYSNGNRYEGNWYKGLKHGHGCMFHVHTGQIQKGIWIRDTAVMTEMKDMTWRQSGDGPTRSPIPKNKFLNVDDAYQLWTQKMRDQTPNIPKKPLKGKYLEDVEAERNSGLNSSIHLFQQPNEKSISSPPVMTL